MTKKEAEDFVYSSYMRAAKYQDFNAKDSEKRRPDLTRDLIRERSKTPCTVITGSKGKGSTSVMISEILQAVTRVGLMTSPHISDFCERFRIDGCQISDEEFTEIVSGLKPDLEAIDMTLPEGVCISPMGIQTLIALSYFGKHETGFNVFECGKGARYDDVNNIVHEYAVIGSIFPEHTRELGDTVEEIACDKSHVITGEQKCVFVAQQQESVLNVIKKRAKDCDTPLRIYGRDFEALNIRYTTSGMKFDVRSSDTVINDIIVPLLGEHQPKNCALAIDFCREVFGITDPELIRDRVSKIRWPGRMEILSDNPFVMLDACINRESCNSVLNVLRNLDISKCTVIIGIPDDKDFAGVAEKMSGVASKIILTKSGNPHYIFTQNQCKILSTSGIDSIWTDSVSEAISLALENSKKIVILGTTSVVAETLGVFYK